MRFTTKSNSRVSTWLSSDEINQKKNAINSASEKTEKLEIKWDESRKERRQKKNTRKYYSSGGDTHNHVLINDTCICHNRFSFPMMAAVAVFDAVVSNLNPNSLDDVALPCCPDDGTAAAAAVAVWLGYFAYSNRSVQMISCAYDHVTNELSILNDEYYGEATLSVFHHLSVAMDVQNCNRITI